MLGCAPGHSPDHSSSHVCETSFPAVQRAPYDAYERSTPPFGALAMAAAWTVKDNNGQLIDRFIAPSRIEVGRKVVPHAL